MFLSRNYQLIVAPLKFDNSSGTCFSLGINTEKPLWGVLVNARQQWVRVVPSWNPRLLERLIHSEVQDKTLKNAVGDREPSFLFKRGNTFVCKNGKRRSLQNQTYKSELNKCPSFELWIKAHLYYPGTQKLSKLSFVFLISSIFLWCDPHFTSGPVIYNILCGNLTSNPGVRLSKVAPGFVCLGQTTLIIL